MSTIAFNKFVSFWKFVCSSSRSRRRRVVVGVCVFVYSILISSVPELFFVNFAVHTPKYPHIYYAFMCVLLVREVALRYLNLSFSLDRVRERAAR